MATTLWQSSADTVIWACGCSHRGNFCNPCILAHLVAPSGDLPHQVSPLGSVGQFTCGMCNGHSEAAAKQQGEGGRSELLSNLSAKRNQMNEEVTRAMSNVTLAMSNVNSFHDMAILMLTRLQDTEAQLALCRKQLSERPVVHGFDSAALNEIQSALKQVQEQSSKSQHDSLFQKNQELNQKVGELTDRLQTAEKELQAQQALREEIAALKTELICAEKDSLETLTQRVAGICDETQRKAFSEKVEALSKGADPGKGEFKKKLTALKLEVSACCHEELHQRLKREMVRTANLAHHVVPIVNTDPDSLSPQSENLLLQLAARGIEFKLSPAYMREIAAGCLKIAKVMDSSKVGALAKIMNERLKEQPCEVLKFVKSLEGVVYGLKDESKAQLAITSLMNLGEERKDKTDKTFEKCLLLLSRLRDQLKFAPLSEFTIAMVEHFMQQPTQGWRDCLLNLPMEWEAGMQASANGALKEYFRNLREMEFREGYLLLGKLLEKLELNEDSLCFFTAASRGMKNDALADDYKKLIEQVERLITSESGKDSTIKGRVPSLLRKLLREDKLKNKELTHLRLMLEAQTAGRAKYQSVGKLLAERLEAVQTPNTVFEFGHTVLTWILPNNKPRDNLDLIEKLLEAMANEGSFEETAKKATQFLAAIARQPNKLIDDNFLVMLQSKIPLLVTCDFSASLASEFLQSAVAGQLNTFLAFLQEVMNAEALASQFVAKTAELLADKQSEATLKVFQLYSVLKKRGVDKAAEYCLTFCMTLGLLNKGDATRRLISAFVDEIVSIENGLYSSAFKLWDFSNRMAPPGKFLSEALIALKNVPKSAEAAINGLMDKVKMKQLSDEEKARYVKIVLKMGGRRPEMNDETFQRLSRMLDEENTVNLAKALATVSFEHVLMQAETDCHVKDSAAELRSRLVAFSSVVESASTQVEMLNDVMKIAFLEQTENLKKVVTAVNDALAKSPGVANWADKIVFLLPGKTQEEASVLSYVPQLAKYLLDLIDVNATNTVCRNLIESMSTEMATMKMMTERKMDTLATKIAAAVNRGQMSARDLMRLIQEEAPRLANVRSDGIRLFNFETKVWGPKAAIQGGRVKIDDGSCYTFLSEDSIFCCGCMW